MFDQEVSPASRTGGAAAPATDLGRSVDHGSSSEAAVAAPPDAARVRGLDSQPPAPGPASLLRLLRAALLTIIVGAAVTVALASGIVPGGLAVMIFAMVVLAVPTSRQLSRRVLLAGCLFFGWVPLLYWWDLPVGDIGRSPILFAVISALLAGWIAVARNPVRRLRRLLPRLRAVDTFPLLASLGIAAILWKWIQVKSGVSAMAVMIPGWDHSAHYAMTHSIRLHGVTTQGLAATAGQGSPFDGYPQSFHAVVAWVMELLGPASPGSAESEINLYTQSVGLVLVAAVGMLCAGLCALPTLRRRPAVAFPLVVLIGSAFVLGPGGAALQDGFPNLVLASALVAAIPLLTVPLGRVFNPLHLAAIGGAIVGIAHGWAPLLLLALPGVLVLLIPLRRSRWMAARSSIWLSGLAVAATAAGLAWAAFILIAIPLDALAAPGGVSSPALGMAAFFTLSCLAGCLLSERIRPGLPDLRPRGPSVRTTWLAALPISGLLGAAALAAYQLSTVAEVSYYFWKFAAAVGLVCVVGLGISVAGLLSTVPRRPRGRTRTVVAVGALALAATQIFGFAGPTLPSIDVPAKAPGATARDASERLILEPPLSANMINEVDRFVEEFPGRPVFYISAPADGRTRGYSMTQWFLGLTDTWTLQAQATVADAQLDEDTVEGAATSVERVLRASPDNIVAVGPEIVDEIRRLIGPGLANRVMSW